MLRRTDEGELVVHPAFLYKLLNQKQNQEAPDEPEDRQLTLQLKEQRVQLTKAQTDLTTCAENVTTYRGQINDLKEKLENFKAIFQVNRDARKEIQLEKKDLQKRLDEATAKLANTIDRQEVETNVNEIVQIAQEEQQKLVNYIKVLKQEKDQLLQDAMELEQELSNEIDQLRQKNVTEENTSTQRLAQIEALNRTMEMTALDLERLSANIATLVDEKQKLEQLLGEQRTEIVNRIAKEGQLENTIRELNEKLVEQQRLKDQIVLLQQEKAQLERGNPLEVQIVPPPPENYASSAGPPPPPGIPGPPPPPGGPPISGTGPDMGGGPPILDINTATTFNVKKPGGGSYTITLADYNLTGKRVHRKTGRYTTNEVRVFRGDVDVTEQFIQDILASPPSNIPTRTIILPGTVNPSNPNTLFNQEYTPLFSPADITYTLKELVDQDVQQATISPIVPATVRQTNMHPIEAAWQTFILETLSLSVNILNKFGIYNAKLKSTFLNGIGSKIGFIVVGFAPPEETENQEIIYQLAITLISCLSVMETTDMSIIAPFIEQVKVLYEDLTDDELFMYVRKFPLYQLLYGLLETFGVQGALIRLRHFVNSSLISSDFKLWNEGSIHPIKEMIKFIGSEAFQLAIVKLLQSSLRPWLQGMVKAFDIFTIANNLTATASPNSTNIKIIHVLRKVPGFNDSVDLIFKSFEKGIHNLKNINKTTLDTFEQKGLMRQQVVEHIKKIETFLSTPNVKEQYPALYNTYTSLFEISGTLSVDINDILTRYYISLERFGINLRAVEPAYSSEIQINVELKSFTLFFLSIRTLLDTLEVAHSTQITGKIGQKTITPFLFPIRCFHCRRMPINGKILIDTDNCQVYCGEMCQLIKR